MSEDAPRYGEEERNEIEFLNGRIECLEVTVASLIATMTGNASFSGKQHPENSIETVLSDWHPDRAEGFRLAYKTLIGKDLPQ